MEKNLKNKEEAKAFILGKITGLNDARLSVWGIGFDKDETARLVRKFTTDKIFALKEMIEIDNFGDSMFESIDSLIKQK